MARPCQICDNGLAQFVRDLAKDGKAPATIIKQLKQRYELEIQYHQYNYHVKNHDPKGGTTVLAKRAADKLIDQANDAVAKSQRIVENTMAFMDGVMALADELDPGKFHELPYDKQVGTLKKAAGLMLDMKKIEITQQKLDWDRNPALNNVNRLISKARYGKKADAR